MKPNPSKPEKEMGVAVKATEADALKIIRPEFREALSRPPVFGDPLQVRAQKALDCAQAFLKLRVCGCCGGDGGWIDEKTTEFEPCEGCGGEGRFGSEAFYQANPNVGLYLVAL